MGPGIPVAGVGQPAQRAGHIAHFGDLPIELGEVIERDPLHVRAGAPAIAPQPKQIADTLDREPEVASAADEVKPMHILRLVDPVVAVTPAGRSDETDRLVMADHLGRDT